MEFESVEKILSLSGSAIALMTTLYFWLVRANNERPNLSMVILRPLQGTVVLPQEDIFPYHNLKSEPEEDWIRYSLDFALVNNSSLPNAALGFSAEVLDPNGDWQPVHCKPLDDRLIPISLSPLATTRVEMLLYLPTKEKGATRNDRIAVAKQALHPDGQIRMFVHALNDNQFEFIQSAKPTTLSIYQPDQKQKAA